MNRVAAILPAAGLGTRMGAETPKQFLELDGVPLVIFALRRLAACMDISEFLIATLAEEEAALSERVAKEKLGRPVRVVRGGGTRQESVGNALAQVGNDVEFVLVHDAVRPLVTREQIDRAIAAAREIRRGHCRNPRARHSERSEAHQPAGRCRAHHRHGSARAHRPRANAAGLSHRASAGSLCVGRHGWLQRFR